MDNEISESRSWAGKARNRAVASVIDQILCSAGNFLILLAALHLLDLPGVAACTLAYTAITLVLSIVRPLVLTPLVIRFTPATDAERHRASSMAAGASLLIGVATIVGAAAASLVLPRSAAAIVLAAAVAVPPILVQDAWRYHCFASGRPWSAALNDSICLVATASLLVGHVAFGEAGVASLILVWGAGAGCGAMVGCVQLGLRPAWRSGMRWIREHRDLGAPLAGAGLIMQSVGRIAPILIGAIVGMAALGRVSAAQSLMLPMNTLLTAAAAFMLPESARRLREHGPEHVFSCLIRLCAGLALMVTLFATVVRLLPDAIGRTYAGGSWDEAVPMLIPVAGWTLGIALSYGSWIGLQTYGRSKDVLVVSVIQGTLQIVGAAIGASTAGLQGGAWGITAGSLASSGVWYFMFRRATRLQLALQVELPPGDPAVPAPRDGDRSYYLT